MGGNGVEIRQTRGEKWVPQRHSVSQHGHDFTSKGRESHKEEERHICPCLFKSLGGQTWGAGEKAGGSGEMKDLPVVLTF